MFREGQVVTNIGDGSDGVPLGAHGRILLLSSPIAGHVQWLSEPLTGQVSFVPDLAERLTPSARRVQARFAHSDGLEDSLAVGPVDPTGARHLMAVGGAGGVLDSLVATGALGETGDLAEEALGFVERRLRQTASVRSRLVELDEEDRNEVYRCTARAVLDDAFGSDA